MNPPVCVLATKKLKLQEPTLHPGRHTTSKNQQRPRCPFARQPAVCLCFEHGKSEHGPLIINAQRGARNSTDALHVWKPSLTVHSIKITVSLPPQHFCKLNPEMMTPKPAKKHHPQPLASILNSTPSSPTPNPSCLNPSPHHFSAHLHP